MHRAVRVEGGAVERLAGRVLRCLDADPVGVVRARLFRFPSPERRPALCSDLFSVSLARLDRAQHLVREQVVRRIQRLMAGEAFALTEAVIGEDRVLPVAIAQH